jgi:alkanesulfonate monooxygenase SsuD/methylene tetrahydromethanopterin reductase-like flavin-dependent oxidoreductase (luciferase family)
VERDRITFTGTHYPMRDVHLDPPPAQTGGPPIVVAGRRDAAIRRAARLGDGWMPYLYSPARYARSVAAIRDQAAAAGRDLSAFHWMACVFVTLSDDRRQARDDAALALAGALRAEGNPDFHDVLDRVAVAGDVDDVQRGLRAFLDAGAEHVVLMPVGVPDARRHRLRLVTDVVPALRNGG